MYGRARPRVAASLSSKTLVILNVPVYYKNGQVSLVAAPKTRVICFALSWYVSAVAATSPCAAKMAAALGLSGPTSCIRVGTGPAPCMRCFDLAVGCKRSVSSPVDPCPSVTRKDGSVSPFRHFAGRVFGHSEEFMATWSPPAHGERPMVGHQRPATPIG